MRVTVFVLLLTSGLLVELSVGCVPKESRKGNPPNGALKCYQCTSGDSPDDKCRFSNWQYANSSERRFMEMQCPRRSSSFCLLRISMEDEDRVERGCYRNYFPGTDKEAFQGCFFMGDNYRACLCTTDLCNAAASISWLPLLSLLSTSAVPLLLA